MLDEFLPKRKIGYLSPLPVGEYLPYWFYQLAPKGIMPVMLQLGVRELTLKEVERVLAPLEEHLAKLVERGVDIIGPGGVPLTLLMGMEKHDKLLAHIKKVTGISATSTVLDVIAAAKFLGTQNIALVNQFKPDLNKVLGLFFAREGIQVAGIHSQPMELSKSLKLKDEESLSLAYELGREALRNNPEADWLYIGGGAWLLYPIVEPLEKEFGKPVITVENATIWHICHLLDYWKPISGYGRLLETV